MATIRQNFEIGNLVRLECAVGLNGPQQSTNGTVIDVKVLSTGVWCDLILMETESTDQLKRGCVIDVIAVVRSVGKRPALEGFCWPANAS